MKKINWKVRVRSPQFWLGLSGVIAAPILSYFGARPEDMTTWMKVWQILKDTAGNPYLIGSAVFAALGFLGVLTDPTTIGFSDSKQALTYQFPKKDRKGQER